MKSIMSRRRLLRASLQVTVAGAVAGAMRTGLAADRCANSQMDAGLASSLHYTESGPDATKTCSACGFFQAGTSECGSCMIFSALVNPKGHCDSWSQKS